MTNIKRAKPLTVKELEQAKALSALGKSYRQIGFELGRSDKTIKKALTKSPEIIKAVDELKAEVAELYDGLARRILESITDETIKEAKLKDRVVSAGVCTDKARLLKGEPTSIIDISQYDALKGELEKLNKELIEMGANPETGMFEAIE